MSRRLVLAAALLALCACFDMSPYFDKVLEEACGQFKTGVMPLPDQRLPCCWLNVTCTNGSLRDLRTLRREGKVTLEPRGDASALHMSLVLEVCQLGYTLTVNSVFLDMELPLVARCENLTAAINVTLSFADDRCCYRVEQFNITRMDNARVACPESGLLGSLVSFLASQACSRFKEKLMRWVSELCKKPFECFLNKYGDFSNSLF